jgi:hypothetical protein
VGPHRGLDARVGFTGQFDDAPFLEALRNSSVAMAHPAAGVDDSFYRIHGTDAPWTIGMAISKGGVRMYNEDVLDLYPRASVGGKVTVTWQRFNTAS